MNKNLIYHICPFKSNEEWVLNIQKLLEYWHVFNNKKVIAIVQGKGLVDAKEVKKYFSDEDIKFFEIANNPDLREVATFVPLLSSVYSTDENEITFYAHAKGTFRSSSREWQHWATSTSWRSSLSNEFVMNSVRCWRDYMYQYCLSNMDRVIDILKEYVCCGCFRRSDPEGQNFHGNPLGWHFSGTFFWFNNKKIFSRSDWAIVENVWHGVESYLGEKFKLEESYCIVGDNFKKKLFGQNNNSLYTLSESEWKIFIKEEVLKIL